MILILHSNDKSLPKLEGFLILIGLWYDTIRIENKNTTLKMEQSAIERKKIDE